MMFSMQAINHWAEWMLPLLWKATWQGGLALLLVTIVCRVLTSIPARVQCWLWRLAFLKLLVAGIAISAWELPWLPPQAVMNSDVEIAAMEDPAPPAPVGELASVAIAREEGKITSSFDPSPLGGERLGEGGLKNSAEVIFPTSSLFSLSMWAWLLLAWSGGVVFALARLRREWSRVRHLVANASAVDSEIVLKRLADHCRRMRLSRPPRLYHSERAGSPCLVGVLRPKIIVPSKLLQSPSSAMLDSVLLHELAHIRRRDLLWNWLPAVVDVLFYYHPMVWWAKREWRVAQEIATDALVISSGKLDVASYAQTLVELVATGPPTSPAHLAVGVTETFSQLQRRIVAMKNFSTMSRYGIAMTVIILAVAVFAAMPWKLTAQESSTNKTDTQPVTLEQLAESVGHMKKIVLAMQNYADQKGHLPAAVICNEEGEPLLSWRVSLLPYLGQQSLYDQFHLDERWDSKHNKTLINKMPAVFASHGGEPVSGLTRYLAVVGNETVFRGKKPVRLREIADGISNTIAFVESVGKAAMTWTEPNDLKYSDPDLRANIVDSLSPGFLVSLVDGEVMAVTSNTSLQAMLPLFNRNDGQVINYSTSNDTWGPVRYKFVKNPNPRAAGTYGGEMGGYGGEMGGYGGRAMGSYGSRARQRVDELELVLTTASTVEILGKQVPIKKLGPILAAITAAGDGDSSGHVAIQLPPSTDYQHVRELTAICEQHGFQKIRILSHTAPK